MIVVVSGKIGSGKSLDIRSCCGYGVPVVTGHNAYLAHNRSEKTWPEAEKPSAPKGTGFEEPEAFLNGQTFNAKK